MNNDIDHPYIARKSNSQSRFKLNVWVLSDCALSKQGHILTFQQIWMAYNISSSCENCYQISLTTCHWVYVSELFSKQMVSPHFSPDVREYNTNIFLWIGKGGAVPWPLRSLLLWTTFGGSLNNTYTTCLLLHVQYSRSRQRSMRAANHLREEINLKACVR